MLVDAIAFQLRGSGANLPARVWHDFLCIVNDLPGVIVLATVHHVFPSSGFSGVILIWGGHAAIHTWPEHNLAWAELVTRGDPVALEEFRRGFIEAGYQVVSAGGSGD